MRLALARLGVCFAASDQTQEQLCLNASSSRFPLRRTSGLESPPSHHAEARSTARFIKHNCVLCPIRAGILHATHVSLRSFAVRRFAGMKKTEHHCASLHFGRCIRNAGAHYVRWKQKMAAQRPCASTLLIVMFDCFQVVLCRRCAFRSSTSF